MMATAEDIMDAIAAVVAGALYPDGKSVPSVAGCHVKVYPGWPVDHMISEDMRLGIPHVSVFKGDNEVVLPSGLNEWREHCREAKTLTVTVDEEAQTITIGGAYASRWLGDHPSSLLPKRPARRRPLLPPSPR